MHTHKDILNIPEMSLVVLIGASGSGKSTFARQHFLPSEIVSSDACRAMVSNDENAQEFSKDAFEVARFIISKRLKHGLLTVVDATNVRDEDRADWVRLAREFHVLPVAIVLNMPEKVCTERHAQRTDRSFGAHVIPKQTALLRRGLRRLRLEGFRHIHELRNPEEVAAITSIRREPLFNNLKSETGPFDIIGDIHGCHTELVELIQQLNYHETDGVWRHPEGRRLVFLGDLVDRGPASPAVLKLVMKQVKEGAALCVPGNHDVKLVRWLNGKNVQLKHGLEQTVAQLSAETPEFLEEIKTFLDGLVSHYVLDGGKLVVAHAGLKEEMQGRGSGRVREFCYYGETTGETDEFGLPVRHNWAADYNGKAMVVYGHTPVPSPQWLNRTIDIDTGCVFGGSLTALRYPEKDLVSVKAKEIYCEPVRPLHMPPSGLTLQQQHDDVLNIADFNGKMLIENRYGGPVTIREQHTIAALEVMSRFAVNPKWLIYLPPTMSPAETSKLPDFLEHPAEAFSYFRGVGVTKVICEEKHMGSRAVVIVAKDEKAVEETFGIKGEGIGVVYTRTGRSFFTDKNMEQALLQRLNKALAASGFYEKFNTDWACFDCELMPWSAKALSLIETQYASTGAAATHALSAAVQALRQNEAAAPLLEKYSLKHQQATQFIDAYRQYCWPVNSLDDYKLAPFHIMATAGKTWFHQDHEWHMDEIAAFCEEDKNILLATPFKVVHLEDEEQVTEATEWWNTLTGKGGEGMVVKSYQYLHQHARGIAQPAIKIRGREYLRIIYGPEYTTPAYLERLKARGLSAKRSLALREFVLGLEGLERFVSKDSLKGVHECVFGVLALESEPVDPRL
ncbi:polynucleotide kinase-phosphatase [Chitinophaga barathri]|uniref:Polynucleotide kinase-phosphatase n=1 Tax=Chitinophaga barathri TaxID=1647451 RepID=A0A3N4MAG8_9BACT|nr:polynucleotide kinase-phosphatase [Chitinophaga barathri]RPD40561.1 polynucleotide kinase-phosphatase [Chitinophaga barathri]